MSKGPPAPTFEVNWDRIAGVKEVMTGVSLQKKSAVISLHVFRHSMQVNT